MTLAFDRLVQCQQLPPYDDVLTFHLCKFTTQDSVTFVIHNIFVTIYQFTLYQSQFFVKHFQVSKGP